MSDYKEDFAAFAKAKGEAFLDGDPVAVALIFADWLEEQGKLEQAEFIRLMTELKVREFERMPSRAKQKEGAFSLFRTYEESWFGATKGYCSPIPSSKSTSYLPIFRIKKTPVHLASC